MSRRSWLWSLAALLGTTWTITAAPAEKPAEKAPEKKKGPQVEVVFVLDTTGSMGGLLEGAKAKIWSICNQILSGKPTPDLKVGLVAFRDRGDSYITQVTDLSDDLDMIHGKLKTFQAQGGGDAPESVNQALNEAVTKIKWTESDRVLKIIFLVGDAPPHMDYADDVKYPETCQLAMKKNIVINTILCGNDAEARKHWELIAGKAEGSFVAIAQDGGVAVVTTPYDKRLTEINAELNRTVVCYGQARERQEAEQRKKDALKEADEAVKLARIPTGAPAAAPAADRAAAAGKGARLNNRDLLRDLKRGEAKWSELKDEDLPEELRKLDAKGRKEYIEKLQKKRDELEKEAKELDQKRTAHIRAEIEKSNKKNSFDGQVLEIIRKQAKKHNIAY